MIVADMFGTSDRTLTPANAAFTHPTPTEGRRPSANTVTILLSYIWERFGENLPDSRKVCLGMAALQFGWIVEFARGPKTAGIDGEGHRCGAARRTALPGGRNRP